MAAGHQPEMDQVEIAVFLQKPDRLVIAARIARAFFVAEQRRHAHLDACVVFARGAARAKAVSRSRGILRTRCDLRQRELIAVAAQAAYEAALCIRTIFGPLTLDTLVRIPQREI